MNNSETKISLTITGLIRNYWSNFLSYLYLKNGWKRTMFEISKENIISDNIRIIITNTGTIILTCYSMGDILTAMEFIVNEFEYARMSHYLIYDEKVIIKTSYVTTIVLDGYCYETSEYLTSKYGTCGIYKNIVTLKYDSYEDGYFLICNIRDVFFSSPNIENTGNIREKKIEKIESESIPSEVFIFSGLLSWSLAKILQYL